MAGGFFFTQNFLALKPVPTMNGGVVSMIGLGLCRIGVGMAGVVLSYRVTLKMLDLARFARDASSV